MDYYEKFITDPDALLVEIGVERFLEELDSLASAITRVAPLGCEDVQDPQDWVPEAIALAHGFEALRRYHEEILQDFLS